MVVASTPKTALPKTFLSIYIIYFLKVRKVFEMSLRGMKQFVSFLVENLF
jgi:hypothetical protein